jgi:DNA-binding phage protein
MLTAEDIKVRLTNSNLRRVAQDAGIHPSTLYRFSKMESKPSYATIKLLSDYFESRSWLI